MSPGQPSHSPPRDLVMVVYAMDAQTHWVRRRELLCGATQRLATFGACGEAALWGPAGLQREHVIALDQTPAIVTLQKIYASLDSWYDAAVANGENGDHVALVNIAEIRSLYNETIERLAEAGS